MNKVIFFQIIDNQFIADHDQSVIQPNQLICNKSTLKNGHGYMTIENDKQPTIIFED
jgi:hypothetical protein